MNRFETHQGRMPFWQDDLKFLQDSFQAEILNLVRAMTGRGIENAILSGCQLSQNGDSRGTTFRWKEGYILLNGEVLKVSTGELTSSSSHLPGFVAVEAIDIRGDREMEEGDDVSCYILRSATLKIGQGISYASMDHNTLLNGFIRLSSGRVSNGTLTAHVVKQGACYMLRVNGSWHGLHDEQPLPLSPIYSDDRFYLMGVTPSAPHTWTEGTTQTYLFPVAKELNGSISIVNVELTIKEHYEDDVPCAQVLLDAPIPQSAEDGSASFNFSVPITIIDE